MSTIYGPQKGHATLYDTLGDDTIIAAGGYNTIYSLYGNDTISGGSIGYNTILAGSQYDQAQRDVTIRVNGLGNTIDGGDANFTVFASTKPPFHLAMVTTTLHLAVRTTTSRSGWAATSSSPAPATTV